MRLLSRRRPSSYPERVLAAADDLVAAGEPIDAIRLLTEANRAQPDRRVEQRLVALRFAAFQEMSLPAEPNAWLDVGEDLFPGELVPEIRREDLTVETLRSGIGHHGSLFVRGLVDQEHVDRLIADIDTAFDAFDARANRDPRPDLAGWYEPFEHRMITDEDRARKRAHGNILSVESPPTLFDLIETLNDAGVGQLAEDYFGEAPMTLARKATLRRLAHNATGGWHQDGAFMGTDIRSINVWLALTHCGDDAPGLDVVGRRVDYIVETGDSSEKPRGGGHGAWGVSAENAEKVAAGTIVRPIFEAGDAMIFDQLCLHRTGTDRSMTNSRYATETWLFAPSTYAAMMTPRESGYSPRDQVPLVY